MNRSLLYGVFRICRFALLVAVAAGVMSAASPKTAFAKAFTCHPVEVAVFPKSRLHVRCFPGDGAIEYFALGVADADANRTLSILSTAFAAEKSLMIYYDPADLSGVTISCLLQDCRLIQGAAVF
jgi:hypothetical protein